MEELRPEDIEELLRELEEERGAQEAPPPAVEQHAELEGESGEEALSPEVEELLRDLQPDSQFALRKKATEQLGRLGTSHQRIVSALVAVQAFDKNDFIRTLAAESLRAPVHQEVLQEHPDLMQRAQPAAEQAEIQRERQREEQREKQRERQRAMQTREVHSRKTPKVDWRVSVFIVFGIVWVVVSGKATSGTLEHLLLALPGVGLVVLGLWKWRSAMVHRSVLLRSMKATVGTVEAKRKSISDRDSEYGSTTTYYATVCFEAEDAKMGTRVMVLTAQVPHRIWKGFRVGERVRIRYAAEDPRIALIEGE